MRDAWETYNASAATYGSVRPSYPPEVFDAIEAYGELPAKPRALEIGVGTGQATREFAERGWSVVGLEPGTDLASITRRDLASFDNVEIDTTTFEAATIADHGFDVVASATAWHWVDPVVGYPKAFRALRDTGTVALFWNAHVPATADPRWAPIRGAYERTAPELATLARLTPDRPDYDPAAELASSALFVEIEQHVFGFSVDYEVDEFLALLDTYASHQHLDQGRRERLHAELRRCIDADLEGVVTKPYEAVLVMGRPKR